MTANLHSSPDSLVSFGYFGQKKKKALQGIELIPLSSKVQQLNTEILVFKYSFVEPDVTILEKSLIMLLTMAELLSLQKILLLFQGLAQQYHTALKNIHN